MDHARQSRQARGSVRSVLSLIGVGGMGEVYARDLRQPRCRIKVLPPFTEAERLGQFERGAAPRRIQSSVATSSVSKRLAARIVLELVDARRSPPGCGVDRPVVSAHDAANR